MLYTVRSGDTPASIAARFGRASAWQELVLTNQRMGIVELPNRVRGRRVYTFAPNKFYVGAKLVVPAAWITRDTRKLVGVGGLLDWIGDDGSGGGGGPDGTPGDTGIDITGGSGGGPGTGGSSSDWTFPGGYCVADWQCPAGKTCSSGQCVGALKDNNLPDPICGTGFHFEVGKGCVKDGASPTCKAAASKCASNSECCSQSCIGGICQVLTKKDPGGVTPPPCKGEGGDCTSDAQCCDGACKSGKCAKKLEEPPANESNLGWWIAGAIATTAVLGTSIWLGARSKPARSTTAL